METTLTTPAPKRMAELHSALLKKSFEDVKILWGYNSRAITSYAGTFHDSLPATSTATEYQSIVDSLSSSDIILFGDFHTFRPTQETFVKIMQDFLNTHREHKIAIALEMNRVVDQNAIDSYLNDKLTEAEFLKKISYQKYWGFPWDHFRIIFEFARQTKTKIIGINARHGGESELHERDTLAAEQICQFRQNHSDLHLFCLVGEYHLAEPHLPAKILANTADTKLLRIFNNTDRFTHDTQTYDPSTAQYLQINANSYCILNAPSWLKWQSLNLWKNPHHDLTSVYADDEFDLDYHFYTISKQLDQFFETNLSDDNLKKFRIAPITDKQQLNNSPDERRIRLDGFSFLGSKLILSQLNHEYINEAAGQFLHLTGQPSPSPDQQDQAFYLRVFQYAAGVFTAKLLNPQQKMQCIQGMQTHLRDINQHHLKGHAKHRRHGEREAIRHQDWLQRRLSIHGGKFGKAPLVVYLTDEHLNYEISRCVGQITGLHLFHLYVNHYISHREVGQLLFHFPAQDIESLWQKMRSIFTKTSPQAFLNAA